MTSIIQELGELCGNELYCKREDLLPYSFGGNKARKAAAFFEQIDAGGFDYVLSYGSAGSNHARVVANLCAGRGLDCEIVTPLEASAPSFNLLLTERFGAKRTVVPVSEVHDTIEARLETLRQSGRRPYFIPGGGHGNLGTGAYAECWREIAAEAERLERPFDLVFLASGTGATQAGLVCGALLDGSDTKIVGISIARKCPVGRQVVVDAVRDYLALFDADFTEERIQRTVCFIDRYMGSGYGPGSAETLETVRDTLRRYGLPLDCTYTGKAFRGMKEYLREERISGKRILFLHTGGTPLFFDDLARWNTE